MIAAAVWLVALAAGAGPALPREGVARYRVELRGTPIGIARLALSRDHAGEGPELAWDTDLRLPAEAGGAVVARRVRVRLGAGGLAAGAARVTVDGVERMRSPAAGAVPASAAELVLLGAAPGTCVTVAEEETGRSGPACAVAGAPGEARRITVLGVAEEVRPGVDGFPDRVHIPGQGVTFVRDAAPRVPARVALPVRVRGPVEPAAARRFCALAPDPPAPALEGVTLPPVQPTGEPCRAQAAAYAAAARRRGLAARIAVGVAHDGAGFVWHAWTEVETRAGWAAVDPAFGQAPALGPRFTVARHGADAAGERAAGRRILACWGAAVE